MTKVSPITSLLVESGGGRDTIRILEECSMIGDNVGVELIERLCREPITADTISTSILYRLYALENIGICSARFIKKSNLIIKEFALTEPVRQVLSTIFRLA